MYKNLYVGDILIPSMWTNTTELSDVSEDRILKKEKIGNQTIYTDIGTQRQYELTNKLGCCRVSPHNLIPLSEYYNSLGFRKKNNHENQEQIYQKVKKYRKEGLI